MRVIFVFFVLFFFLPLVAPAQHDRLAPGLCQSLHRHAPTDSVDLLLCSSETFDAGSDWRILQRSGDVLRVRLTLAGFERLLARKDVRFVQPVRTPVEELTTGSLDLSLNTLRRAHARFPQVSGQTVLLSVKEGKFDTADLDLRGRWVNTGVASAQVTTHASVMATIAAGGGNSSPFARGAAPGARVSSSDFSTLLPDADSVYRNFGVSVQNHSYGTGVENFYGADARAYDLTAVHLPALLHVCSAGNSGTATPAAGVYAGRPIANLTGSFKQAKNILVVGATDSFHRVPLLSSRGPAYDGRVKPELVAFGVDGSSGAAALVSGTAALLQEALGTPTPPPAHLIKAILVNSAVDLNAKGPDFVSGFGALDAHAALQTALSGRYHLDSTLPGNVRTLPLQVGAGLRQLRITLAWTDPAAPANASKALVHDLDLLLVHPATGQSWRPWVPNPHPDSVALPAQRKRDTLNPVEQITVDLPAAGAYQIQVYAPPASAVQTFALAFGADTLNTVEWVYPSAPDVVEAGREAILRWKTARPGPATLSAKEGGGNWQVVTTVSDPSIGWARWTPTGQQNEAQVRLQFADGTEHYSDSFVVSPQPQVRVGFDCVDSFLLYWNDVGSGHYRIDSLGSRYLRPVRSTGDTQAVLGKVQHPSFVYAVTPLVNGRPGLRSFAIDYRMQGTGCYIRSFFATLQSNGSALLQLELGTRYSVSAVRFQKLADTGYRSVGAGIASGLRWHLSDLPTKGSNTYRAVITLTSGAVIYSQPQTVYFLPELPVLVFPNPAFSGASLQILAREPGRYSVRIFDAPGRLVHEQWLDDVRQGYLTARLSAGLYFVEIRSSDGKVGIQKLVVY